MASGDEAGPSNKRIKLDSLEPMASDDEAGPSEERIVPNSVEPIIDVRDMNKLFSKIDNLEHFPLKVLMNIFTRLDYMDLFNLAEKSVRFERIAKIVLNEKSEHEYFIVDETKYKKETYIQFFNRFGNEMTAIEAKSIDKIDYDSVLSHWITTPLMRMKNLKKLILENFLLGNFLFCLKKHITHLILHDCRGPFGEVDLSRFRSLKKFEMRSWGVIRMDVLEDVIRNNPALESIALSEKYYEVAHRRSDIGMEYPFNRLIELVATNLQQLKEFEYAPRGRIWTGQIQTDPPPDDVIDRFFNCLTHLESFGLSTHVDVFMDSTDLLYRLQRQCHGTIKHLKVYDIDGNDIELFQIITSFFKVETLTLELTDFGDEIYTVKDLPLLRELDIALHTAEDMDCGFVLQLLRECSSLEKLTLTGDTEYDDMEWFSTGQFHGLFVESIQNPNLEFTVKFKDQIIGSISKDEVTWRNKLLHWTGYDPDLNLSNVILLDLAKEPSISVSGAGKQPKPFDLILGYLDLNSLCSLSHSSKKCSQLVENYVKQHSQQQGTFVITNEFFRDHYDLGMFAEYVTDVRANILNQNIQHLQDMLERFYNLKKLFIHTETKISPNDLIVSQVRHLIYDGPSFEHYSQLYELSVLCPELETFELKQEVHGSFDDDEKQNLEFRNLQKFTLKYYDHVQYQVKNLRTIFKGTNTKLCLNI